MQLSPPTPVRLARAAGVLAAAYFVFWACAPPTTLPPPTPMAGDRAVGVAVSGGTFIDKQVSCDPPNGCTDRIYTEPIIDGQLWDQYTLRNDRFTAGSTAFIGTSSIIGGGGYIRYQLNDNPDFYIGGQASGGLAWASLGVPMSWHLGNDRWLYTNPHVITSLAGLVGVPIGMTIPLRNDFQLSGEVSATANLGELYLVGYYELPTVRGAVGVSKHW